MVIKTANENVTRSVLVSKTNRKRADLLLHPLQILQGPTRGKDQNLMAVFGKSNQ